MTEEHGNADEWGSCAGGEISGMTRGIQHRRRRVFGMQLACGAMAAVLVGVLFVKIQPAGNLNAGMMTCKDVQKAAKDFLAGRVSSDEKERIDEHLADCPHCTAMLRKMRNKSSDGSRIETESPSTVSFEPAETETRVLLAHVAYK